MPVPSKGVLKRALKAISVIKVLALVSLGKALTPLERRFTSLKRRSSMFVECVLAWWLPG
jgi:hypothetical protein